MSRIQYKDDEEYGGEFALWQANCKRSLRGKRGQAALRELEAALIALPEKRLISGVIEDDGQVCAVGAVIKARGMIEEAYKAEDDGDTTDAIAASMLGWPSLVAWKIVELNDEECDGLTEAHRYERVLARVRELLGRP